MKTAAFQRKMLFVSQQARSKAPSSKNSKSIALSVRNVVLAVIGLAIVVQSLALRWFFFTSSSSSNFSNSIESENTIMERRQGTAQGEPTISLSSIADLPSWIQNYVQWHHKMRKQFPGSTLFTDPNAPPILLRNCLGNCGGLNDRLGQLPWDLYLANQTGRVLLMHWHRPVPLENFLVPPANNNELLFDWRVPQDIPSFFPDMPREKSVSREGMREIRRTYQELFEGLGDETRPNAEFFDTHLDAAIQRATTGSFKDAKVLRHRILGHLNERVLEDRLRQAGETDMIHSTPSFGRIFWMFFRLASPVQAELDSVYKQMGIEPGKYTGVHCRVRHPKATPRNVDMKGPGNYPADKTGLPWEGEMRNYAIETATRALKCAQQYFAKDDKDNDEPVYFFSDSNDLVNYMAHDLSNETFVKDRASVFETSPVEAAALQTVQKSKRVVARDMTWDNVHIDKQKWRETPAYYATFVDLMLAVNARCLAYGVGKYAVFATKISGTSCKVLYQGEHWGGSDEKKASAPQCKLSSN